MADENDGNERADLKWWGMTERELKLKEKYNIIHPVLRRKELLDYVREHSGRDLLSKPHASPVSNAPDMNQVQNYAGKMIVLQHEFGRTMRLINNDTVYNQMREYVLQKFFRSIPKSPEEILELQLNNIHDLNEVYADFINHSICLLDGISDSMDGRLDEIALGEAMMIEAIVGGSKLSKIYEQERQKLAGMKREHSVSNTLDERMNGSITFVENLNRRLGIRDQASLCKNTYRDVVDAKSAEILNREHVNDMMRDLKLFARVFEIGYFMNFHNADTLRKSRRLENLIRETKDFVIHQNKNLKIAGTLMTQFAQMNETAGSIYGFLISVAEGVYKISKDPAFLFDQKKNFLGMNSRQIAEYSLEGCFNDNFSADTNRYRQMAVELQTQMVRQ